MPGLLVEPPGPHVRGRPPKADEVGLTPGPLRTAAAAGASLLAFTSSGEVVLLAVLLGVAAIDLAAAATAALAALALAVRWGSTSLDAMAGAQAVLGPGGLVGPATAVAATWCAAAALVLASPRGWPAVAFGAAAAVGVAGPSSVDLADVVLRVAGAGSGIALAASAGRVLPKVPARAAAVALAIAALGLALAS